jgi:deoxyribodipyrimidine photo-lyase
LRHGQIAGRYPQPDSVNMSDTILWFRLDLRLADNPALRAVTERGRGVLPVFIWAPEAPWEPGAASRWWLHQSLAALDTALGRLGSRLVIRRGPTAQALQSLIRETGADAVFWNRRYEPAVLARDARIDKLLRTGGVEVQTFNAALLREPWEIANRSGKPFQVFTPFWRHCLAQSEPREPLPAPRRLLAPGQWPKSTPLQALELEPKINWTAGIQAAWQPGEPGAQARLREFIAGALSTYDDQRNRPDLPGTSRLSPHLHFGEISPHQIWHAVKRAAAKPSLPDGAWRNSRFLTELGWREFAYHLLLHFPHTPDQPLRAEFARFPWRPNPAWLKAWQRGRTGYPLVDAGLRQLWTTGWMHNRVRMVAASLLVKHLQLSWTEGARWFWDTLVDADLANNTLGWQWTAGCGADAAPFFRIFNPAAQGEKFDPEGAYVRHWVPELARLPSKWLHQPAKAPAAVLSQAGVVLGRTYPEPVVNHFAAREAALEAYASIRAAPEPVPH